MTKVARVPALAEGSTHMVMKPTIAQKLHREQGPVETLQLEREAFVVGVCARGVRALGNPGGTLDSHPSQPREPNFL